MIKNTIKPAAQFELKLNVAVVHEITDLYKNLYKLSHKISKRDKFGIYLKVENACLTSMHLAIKAALLPKSEKAKIILELRVLIEIMKRLVRVMLELEIIDQDFYMHTQKKLQTISKMSAGWIKSVQSQKEV